eukprot:m51a1_g7839 hypothetical protein (187) ;mRNA; r:189965-190525
MGCLLALLLRAGRQLTAATAPPRPSQVRNWKRRYFVLREGSLAYFASPKDAVPCGVIALEDICAVMGDVQGARGPGPGQGELFELAVIRHSERDPLGENHEGLRTYAVCAPDARTKCEWVEAIEMARMEIREDYSFAALGDAAPAPAPAAVHASASAPGTLQRPLTPPPKPPAQQQQQQQQQMAAV